MFVIEKGAEALKRIISSILVCVLVYLSLFTSNHFIHEVKASSSVPVVYWDGMQLLKGQVGRVDVIKPINLWKRVGGKLVFERVLKPGESYRVYRYDSGFGGQYGLGGAYFVTNMKEYIQYRTPSRAKLLLVNPELNGTKKISLGTVTKEEAKVIAPGVTQSKLTVDGSSGKQAIYKLDVDQKASQITFETSLAKDQMIGFETVSSQANRYNEEGRYVIGGVNGDYFDSNGAPTHLTVHNSELVTTNKTPIKDRVIFGVGANGKAMIGSPDISISMTVNGGNNFPINSVNKRRDANHLVLYTPYFASTTMTNNLGTEVILENISGTLNGNNKVMATVKEVIVGIGSQSLQPGQYVLSGHGAGSEYLKTLKEGDQVEMNLSYDLSQWNNVRQAIGGRYQLVKNGVVQTYNIAGAHPRTAIGIKADGSVFTIVLDGRQTDSVGVTLNNLAKVMKDFGAVEAMTFDGGGSSTMVTKQPGTTDLSVVNNPSDGKERSVANALFIVMLSSTNPEKEPTLEQEEIITGTLMIESFEGITNWKATGAKYNTVAVQLEKVYVKEGKQSLKVAYDFIGTTGTSGVYASKDQPITLKGKPLKIGMWVYGDNKGHWLRAQLSDANNQTVQLDFTKNVNWTGWKYVEATIPSGLQTPYKLDLPIRYMQVEDMKKNKGQIFVDSIQAIYED